MQNILLFTAQAAQPGQPNMLGAMLPFVLVIAIFYFMIIAPQRRKEKELKKQIDELRAGTRILFCGGFIGTIVEAKQSTFRVEIAKDTVVEIARGAVNRILKDGEAAVVDQHA